MVALAAAPGASGMAAAEGGLDALLAEIAGCPLMPEFCDVMEDHRAGMYDSASQTPLRASEWMLRSAANAEIGEEAACARLGPGTVVAPILPTETRYFTLIRAGETCAIKDLGERN